MSKYLYISGGGTADYAAVTFEQEFIGSRLKLWNKAHNDGGQEYEEGDVFFCYEALELDDSTVDEIQSRMDYDDSKNANYFKVEE